MAFERIRALMQKIGGKEEEEYTPKPVIDRPLDSLRRQRQVQLNEMEKERLKRDIRAYQKDIERKYLWGLKDKKRRLMAKKRKVDILAAKRKLLERGRLLDNGRDEFGRPKNILNSRNSFL